MDLETVKISYSHQQIRFFNEENLLFLPFFGSLRDKVKRKKAYIKCFKEI